MAVRITTGGFDPDYHFPRCTGQCRGCDTHYGIRVMAWPPNASIPWDEWEAAATSADLAEWDEVKRRDRDRVLVQVTLLLMAALPVIGTLATITGGGLAVVCVAGAGLVLMAIRPEGWAI